MSFHFHHRPLALPKASFFLLTAFLLAITFFNLRPGLAQEPTKTIEYSLDRSDLPPLNEKSVTLLIDIANADVDHVIDELGQPLPYVSLFSQNQIMVTTAAAKVSITFSGNIESNDLGEFEIAPLKDNKRWAWSHSFDDNHYLEGPIAVMRSHNLPATMYVVGGWIDQGEPWTGDMPEQELHELLDAGWSLGNHTLEHDNNCQEPPTQAERKASILSTATILDGVISRSNRPTFRVTSFAVPCGGSDRFEAYDEVIREIQAEGTTDILFIEGGHVEPFMIDVSLPFDFEQQIKRDLRVDGVENNAAELIALFDELSQLTTNETTPFWTNSFSHGRQTFGDNTQKLNQVATYFRTTYGEDGSNEAWMAPADVIYSYLIVREKINISQTVILPEPTASPFPSPSPSSTPLQTATAGPTPTRNFATSTPIPPTGVNPKTIFLPFIKGNPASR